MFFLPLSFYRCLEMSFKVDKALCFKENQYDHPYKVLGSSSVL